MQQYFDNELSKYHCSFSKGYNLQHCPITIVEKRFESVDKGDAFGILLTNL